MTKILGAWSPVFAFGVLLSLLPGDVRGQAPPVELPPVEFLPPAFDAVLRAYEDAWGRRDAESLTDLFTEDGFVLRPGHPPARGRDAIRAAYANSGGPLSLRAYSHAMADSIGYIVGGFARHPEDPDIGKFVLALRKAPSGEWLIAADMDNGNSR